MGGSGGSRIAEPVDLRVSPPAVPDRFPVPAPLPPTGEGLRRRTSATAKRKGTAFERRCRRILEAQGYSVVRSAGSHGPADLVATKAGTTLLVQCKTRDDLRREEWNLLRRTAESAGATAILVAAKSKAGERYATPLWWVLTGDKDGTWEGAVWAREPLNWGRL